MAAIIGEKIGALASETSERFNSATSKFKGEHKETCEGIDSMFTGFGAFITAICISLKEMVTSSFFPYLFVTFALNIPPFAYGLSALFSDQCNSNWLIFNSFLSAMHMVTSVYTVHRIRAEGIAEPDELDGGHYVDVEASTASKIASVFRCGAPNSWERIKNVMCYDMVMAIYYILCIFWVIWQGIGTRHIFDEEVDANCSRWVVYSIICGFLYMGMGALAWTASLCFLRYHKLSESKDKNVYTVNDKGGVELA